MTKKAHFHAEHDLAKGGNYFLQLFYYKFFEIWKQRSSAPRNRGPFITTSKWLFLSMKGQLFWKIFDFRWWKISKLIHIFHLYNEETPLNPLYYDIRSFNMMNPIICPKWLNFTWKANFFTYSLPSHDRKYPKSWIFIIEKLSFQA